MKISEKNNRSRGIFVSFEGGEGAGKSTQIQILASFLRERGKKVLLTREPGGTDLSDEIRKIEKFISYKNDFSPEAEALLFSAARAQLVKEILVPELEKGTWILSDRFTDSSIAYQGAGRNLGNDKIASINDFATSGLVPDITILLDISTKSGFERLRSRGAEISGTADRMEKQASEFYEKVRRCYLDLAAKNPARFLVISAEQSPEKIAEEIRNELSKRFA